MRRACTLPLAQLVHMKHPRVITVPMSFEVDPTKPTKLPFLEDQCTMFNDAVQSAGTKNLKKEKEAIFVTGISSQAMRTDRHLKANSISH